MPRIDGPAVWARHLRELAGPIPEPRTILGAGGLDGPLLASARRESFDSDGDAPGFDASGRVDDPGGSIVDVDVRMWCWVHRDDPELEEMLLAERGPLLPLPNMLNSSDDEGCSRGATVSRRCWTIETWTDAELASIQALCHRAWAPDGGRWRDRLGRARRWHLEHTQPDNATNRPWAIPAFVAVTDESAAESRLYAETLLHNMLAQFGSASDVRGTDVHPLCAAILHDAANLLERWDRRDF